MTTLQHTVNEDVDCKNYFATDNIVSAALKGFGEIEADEDFWAQKKDFFRVDPQSFRGPFESFPNVEASPATIGANLQEPFYPLFESPFEKLDDLRDDEEKVSEIISHIRTQLKVDYAQQLADRLEFLVDAAKEERADENSILPESLKNFLSFIQSTTCLGYPDVVLSPSKNIRAQWRNGPNQHFAVEFLETGEARFVIFSPDPNYPERAVRLSGLAMVDSLMEIAVPHGILKWSSR